MAAVAIFCIFALYAGAAMSGFWLARNTGPWSGWRQSAQCQRCGNIIHGFDTPVWGRDKTCDKCGPDATWKRVTAKPVGFSGYEVKE